MNIFLVVFVVIRSVKLLVAIRGTGPHVIFDAFVNIIFAIRFDHKELRVGVGIREKSFFVVFL